MNETRQNSQSVQLEATAAREPFFRRYQIKVKASLRVGPVPTSNWDMTGF